MEGLNLAPVTEASLSRHLENGDDEETDSSSSAQQDSGDGEPSLAQSDYALYEALNLLKGMALVTERQSSDS